MKTKTLADRLIKRMRNVNRPDLQQIAVELAKAHGEDSNHLHAYAFTFGPHHFVNFSDNQPHPQTEQQILELLRPRPAGAYVLTLERTADELP